MDQALSDSPSFQSLTEQGLKLSESDFNAITGAIDRGIKEAYAFLKVLDTPLPKVSFKNSIGVIGFAKELDAINLRLDYLNLVAVNNTPIEYRDQLVCFIPDKFYMILKYLSWMRLFGIEETIHYFQQHGNQFLNVKFPPVFPDSLSPKSLLLSDLEVEARNTVDKIAAANNEQPIWKGVDEYFSVNYSAYYNKPVDELAKLPKPDLPISFEMENLLS